MDDLRSATQRHPVAAVCDRFGELLDELGNAALWSASDADVAEVIRAAEQVTRRAAAVQARAVGEAQRRELPARAGATGPTAWLCGVLGAKPQRARALSRLADGLTAVPATAQALSGGTVDPDQAQVMIATGVAGLPDQIGAELRAKAEAYLLEQAELHHAGILTGLANHLFELVAPELAEARLAERLARDEARDELLRNRLSAAVNHRGRIGVRAEFDAESWAVVSTALDPLAKPAPAHDVDGVAARDPRGFAQRSADALVELARRALASGDLPTSGGKKPQLMVIMELDRLADTVGHGLLNTGTTVTAETVRRFACDARVIPVVLGAAGVPFDVGRSKRTFDGALRNALVVRDRGCAFPACTKPPAWCEGHHIIHWIHGSTTSLANGVLLCSYHHRLVHRGEWTVRMGARGHPEFISPAYIDPDRRPRTNTTRLRT